MNFPAEFEKLISETLELSSTGLDEVRTYAAKRALHLFGIVGEPGYSEAVEIEAHNVAAFAAQRAVAGADAVDDRIKGIILGALRIGVVTLA